MRCGDLPAQSTKTPAIHIRLRKGLPVPASIPNEQTIAATSSASGESRQGIGPTSIQAELTSLPISSTNFLADSAIVGFSCVTYAAIRGNAICSAPRSS